MYKRVRKRTREGRARGEVIGDGEEFGQDDGLVGLKSAVLLIASPFTMLI